MLLFRVYAVALDDVIIVVGALKGSLHASQLVLNAVKLHTRFFSGLANLAYFLFLLTKLQVNTFVLVG